MSSIKIGNLHFRNRVITASGTFGMGDLFQDFLDYSKIGGITLKTVTTQPRLGNPPPRILETPAGLLNSIGLENPGFDAVLASLCENDTLAPLDTNVIFSVAGDTVDDYVRMTLAFAEIGGIDMIELNLSCPNVHAGGATFDADPDNIKRILGGIIGKISKPVTAKLSPNQNIVQNAITAEQSGSYAVTISNTYLGMAFNLKTGAPHFRNKVAGFSGPAVKPLALYNVYRVRQAVRLPIIASGGITCTDDAREFILAGADLLSIGTMNFVEPDIAERIAEELGDGA